MDLKKKYYNSSESNLSRKFDKRFLHLLENGIDCDCEFVVGGQSIVIRGHRFLFSAASEVFHAMFYGDFKEEKSVEVKDLDPEGFEGMKQFIYTGEIEFESALQALSVYIAARKYIISSLSQQCVNFITEDNTIQPSEVLEFDEIRRAHNIPEFEKTCYKIFQQKTDEIIESEFFVSAAPETIELILRSSSLRLESEIDVLHLFEKWVMAEAERKGIAIGKIMATDTINNLKKHIRFLTISSDKFVSDVAGSPILTPEEKIAIACNLKDSDLEPLPESVSLEHQLRNFISKDETPKYYEFKNAFDISIYDELSCDEFIMNNADDLSTKITIIKVLKYICFQFEVETKKKYTSIYLMTLESELSLSAEDACGEDSIYFENNTDAIVNWNALSRQKIIFAKIPLRKLRNVVRSKEDVDTVTIQGSFNITIIEE